MNNAPRNIAGWLAGQFVTSKLTILLLVTAAAIGLVALLFMPREENPQITVPAAEVRVTMPGASAREMHELIVSPLEGILSELDGVKHTFGMAANSLAIVTVEFEVGQDKEQALVRLYDRVLLNRHRLPEQAGQPLIKSIDVDDVPFVTVTLASAKYDDYALKRMADRMADRLRSLRQVSVVEVHGGRDREIRLELDPERLQAFDISPLEAANILAANNIAAPAGHWVTGNRRESVFLDSHLKSADDVKGLVIAMYQNRPVRIEDVADVIDGPPTERDQYSAFGFGPASAQFQSGITEAMPAVTIAVAKKRGANAVEVAKSVRARIDEMQAAFLPQDVQLVITRDDGRRANASVNNLLQHLVLAIAAVFLVLIAFLGWREALIVTINVPVIVFFTLAADYFAGITINRITLFGMIIALGMLVDDAIVVLENINRHYKTKTGDKRTLSIQATAEIGNPTNLATFAVIAVFSSLSVVTGMNGDYFHPIVFTVPVAMGTSLLAAYIIAPWAANLWLPAAADTAKHESHEAGGRIQNIYRNLLSPLLDNRSARRWGMAGIIVLLGLTFFLPVWQFIRPAGVGAPVSFWSLTFGLMPRDDTNTFNITLALPEYTPVEITGRMAGEIASLLKQDPLIADYQIYAGLPGVIDFSGLLRGNYNRRGPHLAEIRVNLADKTARTEISNDIVRRLRPGVQAVAARYPGSTVQLVEDPPGPVTRMSILAEIYAPDPQHVQSIAAMVRKEFESIHDMAEVTDTIPADFKRHRVTVDRDKAALSGVSPAAAASALQVLFGGAVIGRAHIPGEQNPVPIRLMTPNRYAVSPAQMERIFVPNSTGGRIALSEITRTETTRDDMPILTKNNEFVSFIGGELNNSSPIYAVLELDKRLDGRELATGQRLSTGNMQLTPAEVNTITGAHLLWDGEMRLTLDAFRDMTGALTVAISFVYLLLVAYYRSFIIPLLAMAAIPAAFIGVFPAHWLTGNWFSMASMIGLVALAGIVVRNSLLMIDFIRDNEALGMPLREAALEAGVVRFRPIMLTTSAIVLGSAVIYTDPMFVGMAISLMAGTAMSTALTIFVVPTIYYLYASKQQLRG